MANEKFCLRWTDFESNIGVAFRELREEKDFFDVTLVCNEDQIQAHKVSHFAYIIPLHCKSWKNMSMCGDFLCPTSPKYSISQMFGWSIWGMKAHKMVLSA